MSLVFPKWPRHAIVRTTEREADAVVTDLPNKTGFAFTILRLLRPSLSGPIGTPLTRQYVHCINDMGAARAAVLSWKCTARSDSPVLFVCLTKSRS